MNMKASIELFLAAIAFGMGFLIGAVGVGLIKLLVYVAAKAVGSDAEFLQGFHQW